MKYKVQRKVGYSWMDGVETVAEFTNLSEAKHWIDTTDEPGFSKFDYFVSYGKNKIAMYSFGFGGKWIAD